MLTGLHTRKNLDRSISSRLREVINVDELYICKSLDRARSSRLKELINNDGTTYLQKSGQG